MRFLLIIWVLFFHVPFTAQKTLTLEQCQSLFLKNNLLLLAEQYNIDAERAAVIQARIWELPYLYHEFNFLNFEDRRLLDIGKRGQQISGIDQLIYLGGKKRKEVEFAKSNVAIAELQYEQLLRNLKFEIDQSFYEIYFGQTIANSVLASLANLDTLINVHAIQVNKGNIPLKDLVRLNALSLALKNELMEIQKNILEHQKNLRILTNSTENIIALAEALVLDQKYRSTSLWASSELEDKALEKNPEYLTTVAIHQNNHLFLEWQRSLAIPDISVGMHYDRRGGAFNNEINLSFSIPIPYRNVNKGNIKLAEARLRQSALYPEIKSIELRANVAKAYRNLTEHQQLFLKSITNLENLEVVYKGVFQNFQKRNISIIEFTDFLESYNNSIIYLNELKKQIIISGKYLNYLINDEVF